MLLDAKVKPNKKALQILIDGIDEVCKKVIENPTRSYDMVQFNLCVIGKNYSTPFFKTLSEIFKLKGYPFESNMDEILDSDMAEEYKEVNKLFVSHKSPDEDDHKISTDEWLLMAGKVRTYLEHKLENYVEGTENV